MFVDGVRKRSRFILSHFDVQLSQHYMCGEWGDLFFSSFDHFGKNQLTFNVRVYFWTFTSIPLISVSVSMPAPHGLNYCSFFLFNWIDAFYYFFLPYFSGWSLQYSVEYRGQEQTSFLKVLSVTCF